MTDAGLAPGRAEMLLDSRVVINLATGLDEDAERVLVAFLVGTAAQTAGKQVAMFLTKDAVKLGLEDHAQGRACKNCPELGDLFAQFVAAGGVLFVCPICFAARDLNKDELVSSARLEGATPLWQWIGDDATVFSY